jgi:uncharacterized protein (TIGR03067 family)
MMRRGAVGVLLACLVLGVAGAEEKKGPIEGRWKFTKVESNDTDTQIQAGLILTFDKDNAWLADNKDKFTYKVDTTAKPALLDVKTPDKKDIEGIWELKGDTLRICIFPPDTAKGRPTEFHGRDGQILLTLERVKE